VAGRTLAEEVSAGGPFDAAAALAAVTQVCAGLSAIHEAGLVHGDLKANNVVRRPDGTLVLMDLGCAREAGAHGAHLRGTPLYLAPELLDGGPPTVASDLYAVAVLLYFLVTATYPARGESLEDVKRQLTSAEWPRLDARVPPSLAPLLERGLAREPSERFPSAAAFAAAVAAADTRTASARIRRRLRWIAAACITLAVGAAVAIPWTRARARHQNALRSYQASRQLAEARKWPGAANAAKQAVADDPQSAVAHMWLAWCLFNSHAPQGQVVAEADRAKGQLASVSQRERYWIQAVNYDVRGERGPAIRAYEVLLTDPIWPDRDDARDRLIALLERAGDERRAVPHVTRRADSRPQDAAAALEAVRVLADVGDVAQAREYARRLEPLSRPTPLAVVLLPAREAYFREDARLAARCLDEAIAQLGDRLSTFGAAADRIARFELTLGRSSSARRIVDAARPSSDLAGTSRLLRAGIAYWSGDRPTFETEAQVARASGGFGHGLADYLTERNMLDVARAMQSALEARLQRFPDDDAGRELAVSRAHIALARGHPQEAIAHLGTLVPSFTSFGYQEWYYVRASALRAVGRTADARVALQEALPQSPETLSQLGWLRNEMLLAEVDHQDGQEEDEARAVGILERAFAAADPDFPLLRQLGALKARHR
jgi:tetratricopeptide (TPR) repeat protein